MHIFAPIACISALDTDYIICCKSDYQRAHPLACWQEIMDDASLSLLFPGCRSHRCPRPRCKSHTGEGRQHELGAACGTHGYELAKDGQTDGAYIPSVDCLLGLEAGCAKVHSRLNRELHGWSQWHIHHEHTLSIIIMWRLDTHVHV